MCCERAARPAMPRCHRLCDRCAPSTATPPCIPCRCWVQLRKLVVNLEAGALGDGTVSLQLVLENKGEVKLSAIQLAPLHLVRAEAGAVAAAMAGAVAVCARMPRSCRPYGGVAAGGRATGVAAAAASRKGSPHAAACLLSLPCSPLAAGRTGLQQHRRCGHGGGTRAHPQTPNRAGARGIGLPLLPAGRPPHRGRHNSRAGAPLAFLN